jgi:ribonuclease HII
MSSLEELLSRPVAELKRRFQDEQKPLPTGLLDALARDPRRGAQLLAERLRARRSRARAEALRLRKLLRFESELWAQGLRFVAGVDEAGMAPLAGPVTAAAVILPEGYTLQGLDDSKKILDAAKRDTLAARIKQDALCWAVGWAEVEEIDRLNIYHAGLLAMRRAVEGLSIRPDFVLVDARKIPECPAPQRGIIRGDTLSASIAAASVVAKTTRDAHMAELDRAYPGYGLAAHKGYPTPAHYRALQSLGVLPVHRRSFAPVRQALGLAPVQGEFFDRPADANPSETCDAATLASADAADRAGGTQAASAR